MLCKSKKKAGELGETADFLRAVAEVNRLKILCLLKRGDLCVCDIWHHLKLPQNLVSHHLKILKEAGLIGSKKDKTKIIYHLKPGKIKNMLNSLTRFI